MINICLRSHLKSKFSFFKGGSEMAIELSDRSVTDPNYRIRKIIKGQNIGSCTYTDNSAELDLEQ